MIYYNKKEATMEAEEKEIPKKKYRAPLTIFDVIRQGKKENDDKDAQQERTNKVSSVERNQNFLFPLSSLFQ